MSGTPCRPGPAGWLRPTLFGLLFLLAVGRAGPQGDQKDRPLLQAWLETLQYGIDTEVIHTIQAIEEAGERSLDERMVPLLREASSRDLRVAILDYLGRVKHPGAEQEALGLLEESEDQSLTIALIRYLEAIGSKAALPRLGELVGRTEGGIARAAIRALGRAGGEAEEALLLKRFDDPDYPAELKAEIILALGDLGRPAAVERLAAVAENPDEEKIRRMYAADALGRIGDERAVPALKRLFGADDALLRVYAASALARFELEEVRGMLIQGLRDPNVRVRIESARGLADPRAAQAVEILKYKAERDPEPQVRAEAIRALGKIGSGEALEFLRKLMLEAERPLPSRQAALDSLLGGDLSPALEALGALIDREWENRQPRMLEYAGQKLSGLKDKRLEATFLRFLESQNYLLRVYGIRGLASIEARGQRGRLERVAREDPHPAVRRTAELILERL